ncbi:hypothetical protein [Spiroplasma endosymbiont of Labia minor]|uniref:glycoside hydrolase family 38 N-terminal domain-containing protein n=1 Tax=Spiroplasma endosymbiont of Labia minor TaxID=3066305 RepID=UPI0030CA97A9
MKKYKIYMVPHAHWDKEWYFTKELSDVYLIDNMKNIIEANKQNKDESSFVWDGQYSIVDDYLHYFPEDKNELKKLISNKKLIIGPWYSQTDTFNATGE